MHTGEKIATVRAMGYAGAWAAGSKAYRAGLLPRDNPYDPVRFNDEWQGWQGGWQAASTPARAVEHTAEDVALPPALQDEEGTGDAD
jgi:hypothetical protein